MKKRIIDLILILSLFSLLYNNQLISYGLSAKNQAPHFPSSHAAILMDVETGRVLAGQNFHEKMPMASTTKILTGLLAVENLPLDKLISVNPKAVGVEGSSIYLESNERVKSIDLIYGLMLRSGNDAAEAIAYEISGSIEDFATLMNQRAKEIGANNTNFMNPHGLHHDDHYTTAYDLSLITRAALKNVTFKEVVKTEFWQAEREGHKDFANKNKLLKSYESADGVKTGYTRRSGRCLVASATNNNMQFIAVTLNDSDDFNTTRTLLEYGFETYSPFKILEQEEKLISKQVIHGLKDSINLYPATTAIIPLRDGDEEKLIKVLDVPETLQAPLITGTVVGKLSTYLKGELIYTTDIIIKEDIELLTFKDKFFRLFRLN
ncbi:Serine-type D-Ala-D-Ala carboxypeptidase [Alkaliphilus metalliredigens QYMF]|uniref:serine-type D-Ala-D-Ala carboxypeptidase n=1 Tax=Alkaliphilus metalliredigens (strain QYMF) TaxID=293826 RepID=A6TRH7_ALKMQ|nr:D-alanyl-D-alanine carboxypeptidase family protein [Alkaliphilus metalliredigens]ABR48795.1 Serine-type D-Ala-D-Ala carboxypeptidase [Alkaliphilus metalliredigens QYMF]